MPSVEEPPFEDVHFKKEKWRADDQVSEPESFIPAAKVTGGERCIAVEFFKIMIQGVIRKMVDMGHHSTDSSVHLEMFMDEGG